MRQTRCVSRIDKNENNNQISKKFHAWDVNIDSSRLEWKVITDLAKETCVTAS